jgi:hypothetical protein
MEIQINNKPTLLWLDDVRSPFASDWLMQFAPEFDEQRENVVWVKTYKEFCNYITDNEMPELICFDHDLADRYYDNQTQSEHTIWHEKTGYDCAHWLVNYCIDNDVDLPQWKIQSANEVGKENIDKLLKNYLKHKK